MTLVVLDGSGRLSEFHAVPQPLQADNEPRTFDWSVLFAAAGLDMPAFTPVEPQWLPVAFADQRFAWEGPLAEHPGQTFRVEAAAVSGRPVSFFLTGPWSRSARASSPLSRTAFSSFLDVAAALVMPGLMLAAGVLAWRNLKAGRGDRTGATRAALVLFVLQVVAWLLANQHTGVVGQDVTRLFGAAGRATFDAKV